MITFAIVLGFSLRELWLTESYRKGTSGTTLISGVNQKQFASVWPGNWVPAWRAFAVRDENGVAALAPNGKVSPRGAPGLGSFTPRSAISDDRQKIAEFAVFSEDPVRLRVRNLSSGKEIYRLTVSTLEHALGGKSKAIASLEGIAWSPSGKQIAFAHEVGEGIDNGGMALSYTTVLNLRTNAITSRGDGAPLSWIDESRLLMWSDRSPTDGRRAWISRPSRRTRSILRVWAAGWDGHHVVLIRERSGRIFRELWDSNLTKRSSSQRIPWATTRDVNGYSFFAKTSASAFRHAIKQNNSIK